MTKVSPRMSLTSVSSFLSLLHISFFGKKMIVQEEFLSSFSCPSFFLPVSKSYFPASSKPLFVLLLEGVDFGLEIFG
jgi:hypothetical protein